MGAGRLRRAHVAVALAFVAFGTIDGTWVARLPALKQRLGLDSGELGLVIFSVSLVATLLLPVSGWGHRLPDGHLGAAANVTRRPRLGRRVHRL